LSSVPSNDPENRWTTKMNLESVERPLTHEANKCVYVERCPFAMPICSKQRPPDFALEAGQHSACFLHDREVDKPASARAAGF
jgi:ABC-type dipeptide/oligopeptide/nickel transport system ATPase component